MTTIAVHTTKKDLPLGKAFDAFDLVLYHVGYRKRKAETVCFAGMTMEESLEEAREFLNRRGGRFVEKGASSMPYGYWTGCTLERWFDERSGTYGMWKKALIFRTGVGMTMEQFNEANRSEVQS